MSDGVDLVTGYRAEAHITSEDDGGGYASIVGTGNYVSADVGSAMAAEVPSANICRISDGEAWFGGRHVRIEPGSHVDVPIESGTQGQQRRDLIVLRYTKDSTSGKEDCNLVCIKGTPGSTADPATLPGSPLTGATQCDMPLYRIPLSGISVGNPVKLFGTTPSLATITIPPSRISGTLPISKGGTGATTAAAARNALGLGNTAGALPVANGGTGASNAAAARSNLGAVSQADFNALRDSVSYVTAEVGGLRLTRVGKLVICEMYSKAFRLNGSWDTYHIGKIPAGFRPSGQIRQPIHIANYDYQYSTAFWVDSQSDAYIASFGGTGFNNSGEASMTCCWRAQ